MAGVISVRLPDGSQRELAEGTTAGEFAQLIGPRLAKAAVVATVDGHQVDLSSSLVDGSEVAIVTADSEAGREVLTADQREFEALSLRLRTPTGVPADVLPFP